MVSRPALAPDDDAPDVMQDIAATGVALLVVDARGNVLRTSGWGEMLGNDPPRQIPSAEDMMADLCAALAEAAQDSRRAGASVRRYAKITRERPRTYAIFAGPVGRSRAAGSTALLVSDITDSFEAGPQEGESIRHLGHDLRTPLTSMSGAVEILKMGRLGALTPEQAKLVGMLQQGIDLMLSLIERATTPYRMAAERASGDAAKLPPGDGILR